MSFDVFFQGFLAGESSEGGGVQMREVLAPHVIEEDAMFMFLRVRLGDGEADIYLDDDGMLANHISANDPWDLLVRGARAANWVIIPVGSPTCLTRPGQLEEPPDGLDEEVVVGITMRLVHLKAHMLVIGRNAEGSHKLGVNCIDDRGLVLAGPLAADFDQRPRYGVPFRIGRACFQRETR